MSKLTEWADRITGQWVDRDYAPSFHVWQCHDVWLDYLYEVIGGKPGDGHAPGAQGYTYEVFNQFPTYRPALADLFTKHEGAAGIRPGDVVFWPQGSTNHPNSHVVVALGPVTALGTFRCVSQNPGPATITHLPAYQVAGYLRPIIDPTGDPDMALDAAEKKLLTEVHAMLREATKTGGYFNQIPAKVAAAVLDAPIKRTGTDKHGKPRTGHTSLRKTAADNEAQIGYTRRIVERIEATVSAIKKRLLIK